MRTAALESQRTFRALLAAMSRPGTVEPVGSDGIARILAALVDHEVTAAEPGDPRWPDADFGVVRGGSTGGALLELKQGTLEDPADGATAIIEVTRVGTGSMVLELTGPGVGPTPARLALDGLDPDEVGRIQATREGYPRGVDVVLVDPEGRCACLPRSTRVHQADTGSDRSPGTPPPTEDES